MRSIVPTPFQTNGCAPILVRMIPQVKFHLCTPAEIAERIFSFKEEFKYGADKKYSSVYLPLSPEMVKNIINNETLTSTLKRELAVMVKKVSPFEKELIKFKRGLEKEWSTVNDTFFTMLQKECGFNWKYKVFKVGVVYGMTSHYGYKNNAYVSFYPFKEDEFFYPTFAVAEEIFHLAYWNFFEEVYGIKVDDLFDDLYKSHTNSEQFNFWQISELLPEYYLKLPVFAKFKWNLFDRETGYPWIKKMKVLTDPLWENRISFRDFVTKLHLKCGCLPHINFAFGK